MRANRKRDESTPQDPQEMTKSSAASGRNHLSADPSARSEHKYLSKVVTAIQAIKKSGTRKLQYWQSGHVSYKRGAIRTVGLMS
jgi:hypothetical protein